MNVQSLRCEYRVNPLGLDISVPRLSWTMTSSRRGERQTAYQILVATSREKLEVDQSGLWDSGKVVSSEQNQIDYNGNVLGSGMCCQWKVRVWNRDDKVSDWSEPAFWTMGLLGQEDWQAQWIGVDEILAPRPDKSDLLDPGADDHLGLLATPRMLRKEFQVEKAVKRAMAHVTALGLYELRLNGQKVGDHRLAPEWTNYHKRVQVQTYDISSLISEGKNALGVYLANGWYAGLLQNWPCSVRIYGDEPLLLLRLEIELEGGEKQVLVSDSSWKGSLNGPLRFSGIFEGEAYDATREMPGWDRPDFDEQNWGEVKSVRSPRVGKTVWQRNEPIQVSHELQPVGLSEPRPGIYVFSFDQNLVGCCRFNGSGRRGDTIELQHGEMLNPDGTVFTGNLRVVCQKHQSQLDRYTFQGEGPECFEPRFTYHGFQYVEIRGLKERPPLHALTGLVFHSSCPETGSFVCSELLVNRLAKNILWSQRGNFMGVPTDCPQRDERCGYTGDAQFFVRTAVYNMDIAAFFNKWLVDVCQDSQLPGGWFADHAPHYCEPGAGPNIGWSDAGIICTYEIYRCYGDRRIIREHYRAMKRKIEWLEQQCPQYLFTGPVGNGDWLNKGGGVSKEVLGTAYAAFDFKLMAEMARAIGEETDASHYKEQSRRIAEAFASAYVDGDGSIYESSQSGYALAFTMKLVPDSRRAAMASRFMEELERFDWHPATGFIGTPRLLPALHQAGLDQAAYRLLLNRTQPSWLHPVTLGATTIWEHWDSWDGKNPKGGMNSLNHYAFGSVGEYLFGHIGGIQPESPGYERIRIQPVIREDLNWAEVSYESIRGLIRSSWKVDGDRLHLNILIPTNTTALVIIPSNDPTKVMEGGHLTSESAGVRFLGIENDAALFQVGSGQYHFISSNVLERGTSAIHFTNT